MYIIYLCVVENENESPEAIPSAAKEAKENNLDVRSILKTWGQLFLVER